MTLQAFLSRSFASSESRWLLAAAVISLCLFSWNQQITAGDENEGSGIGGTGRTAEPGGSGLGGTGFRPYLGNASDNSAAVQPQIVLEPDSEITPISTAVATSSENNIPAPEMPVPRVIDLVAETQITRNSSPLDISEEIQRAADSSVLLLRQAAEYRSEELEGYLDASFMKSQRESDSQSSAGVASSGHSDPEQPQSWSQLATALSAAGAGDTAQTTQNAENHDDT